MNSKLNELNSCHHYRNIEIRVVWGRIIAFILDPIFCWNRKNQWNSINFYFQPHAHSLAIRLEGNFFSLFYSFWANDLTKKSIPICSLLSGFLSDAVGRRRALMLIVAPAVLGFITLGFANSFVTVCALFFLLSFIFGLKGNLKNQKIHFKRSNCVW